MAKINVTRAPEVVRTLAMGDIVLFTFAPGHECPAMVVALVEDGRLDIAVFRPGSVFSLTGVAEGESGQQNTWHRKG